MRGVCRLWWPLAVPADTVCCFGETCSSARSENPIRVLQALLIKVIGDNERLKVGGVAAGRPLVVTSVSLSCGVLLLLWSPLLFQMDLKVLGTELSKS